MSVAPLSVGEYCRERLGKSDKGSAVTLASRIAREWDKHDFQPYARGEAPLPPDNLGGQTTKRQKVDDGETGAAAEEPAMVEAVAELSDAESDDPVPPSDDDDSDSD